MRILSRWSAVAVSALLVAPGAARAASYGHGDTGVVDVSASPGYAEGEEPLSADPLDPSHLVAVANVFQANLPAPLDRVFGGGGFQDTRVYASQDGGAHWTTHKLDQPWLAADTSGGPFDGTLYVTFETSPFVDDPPKVFVKRSSDQGRTWGATVRVDAGFYKTQFNPRQRPVVGADGTLYIVYVEAPPTVTPFAPQN